MIQLAVVASILTSTLLSEAGFAHGFSLRTGGVSAPPFDSLNLARTVGDDPAAVAENHQRFAKAVGFDADRLFEVSQVHSSIVHTVGDEPPESFRKREGDAIVATTPAAVAVRTADCLPLLVADERLGHVAAVHAGWRGAAAGIVSTALQGLQQTGSRPADLLAAIGPHIGPAAFEVGEEVVDALRQSAPGADFVHRQGYAKPHVDLCAVVRFQLQEHGVTRVEHVAGCTFTDADRFYSFRRDGRNSGRHLAAVVTRDR